MLVLVLGALIVALLAQLDALFDDVLSVGRIAGDEGGREATDSGTVAVETDAGHHHFNIVLIEAGVGAVFAGGHATGQGVEEGAVIGRSVFHKNEGVAGVAKAASPTPSYVPGRG